MTETLVCAHCDTPFEKERGQANRQRRRVGASVPFFCGMACSAARRRLNKPKAQRVAEKAAYDLRFRATHRERLKASKREYFQRTYDPDRARSERAPKAQAHRAYLREYTARPEWREHKQAYDRDLRAQEFGDFAECHALLIELEKAVRVQPWYERARERGYFDNNRTTTERKRHEHFQR